MQLGQKFHLLMQQRELGLAVEQLAADPQTSSLQKWLTLFNQSPPAMIAGDRHSEHRRTLGMYIDAVTAQGQPYQQMYTLTVVYDLLIFGAGVAQIVDWKTHQKPIKAATLKESWQTRLYLYVLAETAGYTPEQITMTYWFANRSTTITLGYDIAQHERTQADLLRLLREINQARQTHNFAQIEPGNTCEKCDFAYRCDRKPLDSMVESERSPQPNPAQVANLPTELIKHPDQLANRLEQIPEVEI
jgi:CRISPR/Cas system-associated exonuclease Cas4 (RecB family)